MVVRLLALALLFTTTAGSMQAADPIVGDWKTKSGETATIAACGAAYCISVKTGVFAGKAIGKMQAKDGTYVGEITDPETNKTYSGSGALSGNTLKMKGCVLGVLCKSQSWTRL